MNTDWKRLLLSPHGRIDKLEFWKGFAVIMGVSIACNLIPVVGPWLGLLLMWPQVCIHAKRLHDMGRSGWWMLIPAFATTILGVFAVGMAMFQPRLAMMAGLTCIAIGLSFLLWIGLSKSDPADNRFGAIS